MADNTKEFPILSIEEKDALIQAKRESILAEGYVADSGNPYREGFYILPSLLKENHQVVRELGDGTPVNIEAYIKDGGMRYVIYDDDHNLINMSPGKMRQYTRNVYDYVEVSNYLKGQHNIKLDWQKIRNCMNIDSFKTVTPEGRNIIDTDKIDQFVLNIRSYLTEHDLTHAWRDVSAIKNRAKKQEAIVSYATDENRYPRGLTLRSVEFQKNLIDGIAGPGYFQDAKNGTHQQYITSLFSSLKAQCAENCIEESRQPSEFGERYTVVFGPEILYSSEKNAKAFRDAMLFAKTRDDANTLIRMYTASSDGRVPHQIIVDEIYNTITTRDDFDISRMNYYLQTNCLALTKIGNSMEKAENINEIVERNFVRGTLDTSKGSGYQDYFANYYKDEYKKDGHRFLPERNSEEYILRKAQEQRFYNLVYENKECNRDLLDKPVSDKERASVIESLSAHLKDDIRALNNRIEWNDKEDDVKNLFNSLARKVKLPAWGKDIAEESIKCRLSDEARTRINRILNTNERSREETQSK